MYPDLPLSPGLKKKVQSLPELNETLVQALPDDVLELDEMWSYVGKKENSAWLWSALCRRTRQIVAFVIGDRGEDTCRRLFSALPSRSCRSYSDKWSAYEAVFPAWRHKSAGKGEGLLSHVERWHNTVRQRLGRYVRKTLSFSKSFQMHELVTRWFIMEYNLSLSPSS